MANKTSSHETEGGAMGTGRQVTRKTTYRPTNNKVTPSLPSYFGHSTHAFEEASQKTKIFRKKETVSEKRPCLVSVEVTPKYHIFNHTFLALNGLLHLLHPLSVPLTPPQEAHPGRPLVCSDDHEKRRKIKKKKRRRSRAELLSPPAAK